MPTLTFTWQTTIDNKTCDKCRQLHGYEWFFYDEMPRVLLHPTLGLVWDMVADQSQAHGLPIRRGGWRCRCIVTWRINDEDLQDDLLEIRRETRLLEDRLVTTTQFLESFIALLVGAT